MLNKKSVDDINVKGKKVLVRCDFNVPFIYGIGDPASAMNFGFNPSAASSISQIIFSSFPMTASISVSPEM